MTATARPRVLLITKGHPFQADPFFAVFDELGFDWTHVEHPDAQELTGPELIESFDVAVMYDMPGIRFTGGSGNPDSHAPAEFELPSERYRQRYTDMLDTGVGLVFLHHAIASWPAWPGFAEMVGGRFHYQPGRLDDREWPDSGYRFDVTHTVEVVDPDHAICAGLDTSFEITDELYLFPVLTNDVVPLLRSSYEFADANFYSADRAIRGHRNDRTGWSHPPGSNLVGWVKNAGNSPLAYIQFGDGPATYADPNYRLVVANAINWAASPDARSWAGARNH